MTVATLTGRVQASCGCIGDVHHQSYGQWPAVYVVIVVPCEAGHPHKVVAGVVERFLPEFVTPYTTWSPR